MTKFVELLYGYCEMAIEVKMRNFAIIWIKKVGTFRKSGKNERDSAPDSGTSRRIRDVWYEYLMKKWLNSLMSKFCETFGAGKSDRL